MRARGIVFFLLILMSSILFTSLELFSQNILESLDDTAIVRSNKEPIDAPTTMKKAWNHFESKYFSLNFGLAIFLDYNIVHQDENNIAQVEKIEPEVEFRAQRIILSGTFFNMKYPWKYLIGANYNGMDNPPDKKTFDFIDLSLEIPFGEEGGSISIGKIKEGVGHEYILPGSQAMFMERGSGVPAIVKQRNIGLRYNNNFLNQRISFSFGTFNNWLEIGNDRSFSDNGVQVTSRVTGLPIYKDDRNLLHAGLGYRFSDAPGHQLSYKARPEANSAPFFINTGSFDAAGSNTIMFELIGVKGPLTFISEYMQVLVNSVYAENPSFNYWQIGAGWFITGDNRKYNKITGNLGKLIPKKNFRFSKGGGPGAFEVALRYTNSDFTDKKINGGIFKRATAGLSWYPNAHFRFEINYGYGKLDNDNLIGASNFWQFRSQFEL